MPKGKPEGAVAERVWLVLQRDLSVWLRAVEAPAYASMVMNLTNPDQSTVEAGASPGESLRTALTMAANKRAREPGLPVPDRIQVPAGLAAPLRAELPRLEKDAGFRPDTVIEEVNPEDGAESVFDHFIAQLADRPPPEEPLLQEDAIFLYDQARRFMEAEPWTRWTSEDALLLELKVGSERMSGIASVLGHAPTQPGVFLMPGAERASEKMASWKQPPVGSLLMQLEGAEIPPDLFLRARRYGWPADAAVTPNFMGIRPEGFGELDRRESWPFALVLAGIVAHVNQPDARETWGHVDLPNGHRGRYRVRKAPEPVESAQRPSGGEMLGIRVSGDLMTEGSGVGMGVMATELLARLREEAEVRLPPKLPFPPGVRRIPFITLTPANRDFRGLADRLRRARPIGATVIQQMQGSRLTILGERAGFTVLQDPELCRIWKQDVQDSDGAHALIVTDQDINNDEDPPRPGRIYGLFECMLRGGSSQAIEFRP